jgi:uncharacterized RDD family membrane protein YckC
MKRILARFLRGYGARAFVLLMFAAATTLRVVAQTPQVPPAAESPAAANAERVEPSPEAPVDPESWSHEVVRIGQDYTLKSGDAVGQAVVIAGTATIEGRVDRDVVVVFGEARLASTASIDGSLIVIGGSANISSGARVRRDFVVVGGRFDGPAEFSPGGEHVVIGPSAFGGRLERLFPWITRGLLWGRLIVPDLGWVWGIVGVFFLVYLILNLIFHQPVRACADTLGRKPLTTFVVGLLVLLLTGPVCLLLAISIIGIAVVPFVLCSLLVAWLVGKVAVARWIGTRVVRQEASESPLQSIRPFAIGFVVICLAYMVPLLGFVTWTMVGVFGLGASTLAFIAAYRGENPAPIPRPLSSAPPPSAPPPAPYHHEGASLASPDAPAIALHSPALSPEAVQVSDLALFPRAAFRDRLAAFVLDVILVAIAQELLDLTRRDSAIFLLLLAYHIGFWAWKGTTVGGIICQLRVVRVDGAPLRFVDALVRGLSSIFSLAVLGLGCLWILKDPERQAWHDKIAGTYVVKVPRNWPL